MNCQFGVGGGGPHVVKLKAAAGTPRLALIFNGPHRHFLPNSLPDLMSLELEALSVTLNLLNKWRNPVLDLKRTSTPGEAVDPCKSSLKFKVRRQFLKKFLLNAE